jgi:membrane-associated phospholipid phosphatase
VSDLGQVGMGLMAVLAPVLILRNGSLHRPGQSRWLPTLNLLRAAAINGVFLEWTRILIQRPRPYVPEKVLLGIGQLNASDFTSFYSGHTSFCFAALVTLAYSARDVNLSTVELRGACSSLTRKVLLVGTGLSICTGVMRILAGRHFVSDVLAGAIMGIAAGMLARKISSSLQSKEPISPPA